MLWFCDLLLSISSRFKISKIGLWKLFCKWKFLCKVEKGVALTSDHICLQKMKKKLVFEPSKWNCWMFWYMVASVGAKYILKCGERLGKKESHLSADRWSLTNKKPPTFPYRLLCFPVGIPYSLQEAIIPYCKRISLRVAALIKSNFFPCLLRFWYPPRNSVFYVPSPRGSVFLRTPLPPKYPPNPLA